MVVVSDSEVLVGLSSSSSSSSEVVVGPSVAVAVAESESAGTGRILSWLLLTSVVLSSLCASVTPPNTATSRDRERRKRESLEKRCILSELVVWLFTAT